MRFDNTLRDGKTKPVAARASCAIHSIEPLKQVRQFLCRNRGAGILYAQERAAVFGMQIDVHRPAYVGVF